MAFYKKIFWKSDCEAFTHDEDPWKLTRGDLDENEKSNKIIEKYSYKMFMNKKFKN